MNKTQKTFSFIGLIIIVATIVIISIEQYNVTLQRYIYELQHPSKGGFWFWEISEIILTKLNIILFEISLFKNIYILLSNQQPEYRKILCSISLVVLFFSFVLNYMSIYVEMTYHVLDVFGSSLDLLSYSWLLLILSFVLGFIKRKNKIIIPVDDDVNI